jgi:putative DNA primase/helicase
VTDPCSCGRPLLTFAGDFEPTCPECRCKPDSCGCDRISPAKTARAVTAPKGRHRQLPPPGAITDDPLPDEPWTQLGYAHRLVEVYGGQMRYVPAWKRWLVWDGRRWAHDQTGYAQRHAKLIARGMTDVVLASDDADMRRDCYPIAEKGETNAFVSGVLSLASTEPEIAVAHDDLDADPFLLNCANGTLDLRTNELRAHNPADLITKVTTAAYDPSCPGATFAAFLERVQPDARMRTFLARLIGHALEGRVTEHILPIFHGAGANGKSTLVTAVVAALGDYAGPADADLLTARSWDAHPTGVADLCGLRLARIDEGDKGRQLGEGTVKRLTGGDQLKARRMREDFWSFDPTHTFLMLTNHKPVVTGTDEGIWRRLRLVPWDVIIPAEERDLSFGDRLLPELDYVLTWLVTGYADWKAHGLDEPEAVSAATAAYRGESDALGRFLDERCMNHGEVRSSDLFAEWQKWCAEESEEPGSQTAFSNDLTNRGYDKRRTEIGAFWKGLGLNA